MKSTIKFFQICLLLCGVLGVDADEVKTVPLSVVEGESVTLNTDLTEIQGISLILWRFGDKGSTIAQIDGEDISYPRHTERFRDRLQLDDQTGSLTIKNMRIEHSGPYKLEIIRNSGTSYVTFSVTVYESPSVIDAGKAEMKSVSVMEGGPVTLQTDVTETHGDELIVWRFGDEGKLIAKHDIEAKSSPIYDTDERFRDRLKLDEKTGSLTITNTRNTDSGLYTVKISSSKQILNKKFSVIISAPGLSSGAVAGIVVVLLLVFAAAAAAGVIYYRRTLSELERLKLRNIPVMEGESVTINPETEIQKDDQIQWRFGDKDILIAEFRGEAGKIHDDDERFRGRLTLGGTGYLIITNMRIEQSGDYKLQISSSRGTTNKRFVVTVFERLNSVKGGESLTINPETEIQKDDQIQWRFGDQDILIAQIKGGTGKTHDDDGRFRGRLKLDEMTGSLTITRMRKEHTGDYKLKIINSRGTANKTFKVVVFDREYISEIVQEGEDVTLSSDTYIVRDEVKWFFIDEILAIGKNGNINKTPYCDERFKDRMELDHQTGSLTIKNIRPSDSGLYHMKFLTLGIERKFSVGVHVNIEDRKISVKEGESVTINPETEIQKDDQIQWRFGDKDILIAEFRGEAGKIHDDDGIFRGRLMLGGTGSLIITNMRIEQSGDYKLQISSSRGNTNKRFVVTVFERLNSVKGGESLTINPETEIQKDDQIQWRFGDQDILIAEIKGGTGKTHDDDGRFRGRLTLDEKTGSLTITRMRPEHTGDYKLKIINSRGTANKTFKVVVFDREYISEIVQEGEDVTLSSDTYIVRDEVKWFFNDKILAIGKNGDINKTQYCDERFKDRMELDHQTGSLTIKNIRTSDTGLYHLKFLTLGIERKFSVGVHVNIEDRKISVKGGESVTLKPETEIQKDDHIQWRFGDQDIPIAEFRGGTVKTHDDVADVRFRGRLTLDEKTGSLTIRNITPEQSGDYKLQISSSRGNIYMRFVVTLCENRVKDSTTVEMPPVNEEDRDAGKYSATVEMPLLNEEDRDAGNEQEGTSSL